MPINNERVSYVAYARKRIVYHLKRNPLRLFRFLNPKIIGNSLASHQLREARRLGDWNGERDSRQERFAASDNWMVGNGLARREYQTYDDYIANQRSKLERVETQLRKHQDDAYNRFRSMFEACDALKGRRNVLCLGARIGSEVKALIDLGYVAIGIDLNPGDNNPYVLYGDFHNLIFGDSSFDAIYTNTMDHCLDPEKMVAEIVRLLIPKGLFIMDVTRGYDEGMSVDVDHSALAWSKASDFVSFVTELGRFDCIAHYELPDPPWTQALLIKR